MVNSINVTNTAPPHVPGTLLGLDLRSEQKQTKQ